MAASIYICKGIGVQEYDICCYLDPEKLCQYIAEHPEQFADVKGLQEDEAYKQADDPDKLDLLSKHLESSFLDVLAAADSSKRVIACHNGEEEYYLLYPARYPWEINEDDAKDENEAFERVAALIHRFAFEKIDYKRVERMVSYILDVNGMR